MTLSYLQQRVSKQLNSSGEGILSLAPDTGQYWLPTLVHVSTRASHPTCSLFAGGIVGGTDPTNLKDFTPLGDNDTTSILSGTVIQRGEAIVAMFDGGFPGDIAFMEIIGLSSDVPPTIGIIPTIPGVRFAGASLIPPDPHKLLSLQLANNIAAPFTDVFPIPTSDFKFVHVTVIVQVASAVRVTLNWYTDSTVTGLLASDSIDVRGGMRFDQTMAVKGDVLLPTVTPFGGNAVYTLLINGMPVQYLGMNDRWTNLILGTNQQQIIGAGATFTFNPTVVIAAPACFQIVSQAAVWNAQLQAIDAAGNTQMLIWLDNTVPQMQLPFDIFLPATPIKLDVHNSDAAPKSFEVMLVAKPFYP